MTDAAQASDEIQEIIPAPLALKKFIRITSDDQKIDMSVVGKAEAALQDLAGDFPKWMEEEVVRLRDVHTALREKKLDAENVRQLYLLTHNLKGQAANLGYPLAGRIAGSLCEVIEKISAETIPGEVIDNHVHAMSAIVMEKASGDGNDIARKLAARLCEVTKEYLDYMQTQMAKVASSE